MSEKKTYDWDSDLGMDLAGDDRFFLIRRCIGCNGEIEVTGYMSSSSIRTKVWCSERCKGRAAGVAKRARERDERLARWMSEFGAGRPPSPRYW